MPKKTFSSEYQPAKRGRRGRDKRNLLLDALKAEGHTEEGFYRIMVQRALDADDNASSQLMKEVINRLYPASKPVLPTVEFDMSDMGNAADKVDAIADAIASGEIPADIGKAMTDILKTGIDIREASELHERIEALEKAINGGS